MRFMTDDGKTFETLVDAENHEKELKEKEETKKKLEKEKQDRAKAVIDAYENYEKLLAAYQKDYCEQTIGLHDLSDLISLFF